MFSVQLQNNRQNNQFQPSAPPAPPSYEYRPSISSPICSPPTGLAVISLSNQSQFLAQQKMKPPSQQPPPPPPPSSSSNIYPNQRNSVINPQGNFADRKPEVSCFLNVILELMNKRPQI